MKVCQLTTCKSLLPHMSMAALIDLPSVLPHPKTPGSCCNGLGYIYIHTYIIWFWCVGVHSNQLSLMWLIYHTPFDHGATQSSEFSKQDLYSFLCGILTTIISLNQDIRMNWTYLTFIFMSINTRCPISQIIRHHPIVLHMVLSDPISHCHHEHLGCMVHCQQTPPFFIIPLCFSDLL